MKTMFAIIRYCLLFCIIIFGAIVVLGSFLLSHFNNYIIQLLTIIILYLTLLAIVWYSWETRQLKIETRRMRKWAEADNFLLKKQNKTNIRPYLRLQKIEGVNGKLRLVNEGKGVAVSLELGYKKGRNKVGEGSITAMAAAPSSWTDIHKGEISLDPKDGCSIDVRYKDIEGHNYMAIFMVDTSFNDGFEIAKQEEVAA
jgi:hypothetical protein